jgi:hypothetical protein
MDVDERPIFGAQSLREIREEEKQGGSMNLTKDEYLLRIQSLVNIIEGGNQFGHGYVDYVAQFADGRVINDMSREELAKLFTSANKAHMAERDVKTMVTDKRLKDRYELARKADPNLGADPVAEFIARQPWGRQ